MEFDNIIEEEKYFPYMDISLDEAREIRYLVRNSEALKNGEVVWMSLKREPNYIYANGLFYGYDCNHLKDLFMKELMVIRYIQLLQKFYLTKIIMVLMNLFIKLKILK